MLACGCTPAVGSATGFRCFLSYPSLSSGLGLGWFLWVPFSLLVLNLCDGVTCGVEAGFSSIESKVWHVSLSPYGVSLCSHCPTCRVTFCVKCVVRFPLVRTLRLSVPHPVAAGAFLVVLAAVECLRMFVALSSVLPFLLLWFHVRLHSNCSRPV